MFSLIIPSFNNYQYLKITIESILKTSKLDNEILVHVNEDRDNKTRKYLDLNKIDYTYSDKNIGLCSSINIIAKKCKNHYIIYSHDDMYFCPNWDVELEKEIKSLNHKLFYLSGSMIEPYSGHIKFFCGENIDEFDEQKLLSNLNSLNIDDHQGSHFAPHCIHKDIWNKIGGFSEEFNPGIGSDPDLNMKLWNEGVRIFKGLNNCKIYHFGSIVTRAYKNHPTIITESGSKGGKIFLMKWGISINFFKKFYLKSDILYDGPLKEPKKVLNYFIRLFICKLNFFYIKFIYKKDLNFNLKKK